MSDVMPHFKFHYVDIGGRRTLCIEAGGKVIHQISNFLEFYRVFGYRIQHENADQLPDEFIWSEYVNNASADFSSCIQIHILEYLKKYSNAFIAEFGSQYDKWMAEHADARTKRGVSCIACSLNPKRDI